jgi:hypothetical protein
VKRLASIAALVVSIASPVAADRIVSVTGTVTGGTALLADQTIMTSWTQSADYSNVSISATLGWPQGSPTPPPTLNGTAYLTNRVGPGTTAANEIASAPFSAGLGFVDTNLFLGLNLSGGTYYLVLASHDGPFWLNSSSSVLTSAPGVSFNGDYTTTSQDAYPPAEPFFTDTRHFLFSVSGTAAVPEPSTYLICILVSTAVAAFGSNQRRNSRRYAPVRRVATRL